MHRPFNIAMRVALVLLIGIGVGLVAYSLSVNRGDRGTPPAQTAGAQPPPAAIRESPPPTSVASEPPTPNSNADHANNDAGAPDDPQPRSAAEKMAPEFTGFQWEQEDVKVSGDKFRPDPGGQITQIWNPVIISSILGTNTDGKVAIALGEITVTANEGSLDRNQGVIALSDNVQALGKDFAVQTDRVTFHMGDRQLISDAKVSIRRDRLGKDGSRTPAMIIDGVGLHTNVGLQTMTLARDVTARMYDVSEDFLATESDRAIRDVVITSDGRMEYEHVARMVSFHQNVRVESGPKVLLCQDLTIRLAEAEEGKGKLVVTNILAEGDVSLSFNGQTARGDKLEWQEVTHTAVLTGQDCLLEKANEFTLTGRRLSFYRMNSRFMSEGPGTLFWNAAQETPAAEETQAPGARGPLQLTRTDPVRVTWTKSMTYDLPTREVLVEGNVVVRQRASSLSCQSLRLEFSEDGQQVQMLEAKDKVSVHEQGQEADRQVACDILVWDGVQDTVSLRAAEGKVVNVTVGRQTIASQHLIFDNAHSSLDCPAPGRLTVSPPESTTGEGELVQVDWQQMMHFAERPDRVAMFSGHVVARQNGQTIRADTLHVRFDPQWDIAHIVATGHAQMDVITEKPPVEPTPGEAETKGILTVPTLTGGAAPKRSRWQVAGETLTIEPGAQSLTSETPGTLTVMANGSETGRITWQESMHFQQAANSARFKGDVKADFADALLDTDELRIEFNNTGQLRNVWANANVRFRVKGPEGWQLTASSAQAVFGAANALRQFIARDSVKVNDRERTLNADILQLSLTEVEGHEEPVITRAVAQGNVSVTYDQRKERLEAGGDKLEWDRDTDVYVLTGQPNAYLRRGMLKALHEKIMLERLTGTVHFPAGARPVQTIVGTEDD